MNKTMKRIMVSVFAFAMLLMLPVAVKAETKDSIPTKVRIYKASTTPWSRTRMQIKFIDSGKVIKNLKSNSKNLKVAIVGQRIIDSNNSANNSSEYEIGMIALKKGTYTVSYDIVKKGKVVSKNTIKVYAYPDPIEVKLEGCSNSYYGTKKTAKLNVKAQKGNTIKKIEVGTYKVKKSKQTESTESSKEEKSEIVYKKVKNNSKINLGTKGYYYKYVSEYYSPYDETYYYNESENSEMISYTGVRVTYVDKYTKQKEELIYNFGGIIK